MRKVIAFVLVLAIALGGLIFAHAAVTDQQDELLVYAQEESGDITPLAGRTASVIIDCGQHLRWYTDFTFGADLTETRFEFTQAAREYDTGRRASLDVYFTGGMGASVSGGDFTPSMTGYGALLRAVAAMTQAGESKTLNLRMADFVDYYAPDYDLTFDNGEMSCSQSMSLHGQLTEAGWYEDPEAYEAFFDGFRFPIQEDTIIAVTVGKNDAGQIVEIDLYPENGPTLYYESTVNDGGIYFVPIFQDETGNPLPFESPLGFGIYYVPWKITENIANLADGNTRRVVTPDMEKLELLRSLDETLRIKEMEISADGSEAWILTLEEAGYVLTVYDLAAGTDTRVEILPYDEAYGSDEAWFGHNGELLVVFAQDRMALVDMADQTLLLTAPLDNSEDAPYNPQYWDPDTGYLEFDGEYLYLLDTVYNRDGLFWAAAFREGEQVYCGLYDCSILRGNDDWHYSAITAETNPITMK